MKSKNQSQSEKDRDAHRKLMEERILESALKLFAKDGVDSVTIRKIASVIGYSPGIVYHYFKDKKAIFVRLREDGLKMLHIQLSEAVEKSNGFARLHAYAMTYLNFAIEHPEYYEIMFLSDTSVVEIDKVKKKTAGSDMFKLLIEEVELAMDNGYLRKAPKTKRIAMLFLSSIHGLIALAKRQRLIFSPDKSLNTVLEETVTIFLEYLKENDSKNQ